MVQSAKSRFSVRVLLELACVLICTLLFLFTGMSLLAVAFHGHQPGTRDYIEYWASGQQLVHHRNPYDAAAVLQLERAHGLSDHILPLVMGNPPPALLLTLPLGFLSARVGEILWMLMLLVAFVASVSMIVDSFAPDSRWLKLLGYSFAPALVCVEVGQMSLLVLLGLAIFLRLHKKYPMGAGAALWLCLLKPQLFLPFGLVLCAWIWTSRQYRVLAGAAISLALSAAVIWFIDPLCWSQYRGMMRLMRYDRVAIPCLTVALRDSVPGVPLLQYLPALLACVWAIAYFWKRRHRWDWMEHGSALILVSLLVAPYTWFVDQCVALPALLRGAAIVRSRRMIATLALASALIEFASVLKYDLMHSMFYFWTTPFYLAWFLVAVSQHAKSESRQSDSGLSSPQYSQAEVEA